jgi:hypothetical protein
MAIEQRRRRRQRFQSHDDNVRDFQDSQGKTEIFWNFSLLPHLKVATTLRRAWKVNFFAECADTSGDETEQHIANTVDHMLAGQSQNPRSKTPSASFSQSPSGRIPCPAHIAL